MLELKIPGLPVSVNSCYVAAKTRGKRFKSKDYVLWEHKVEAIMCATPHIPNFMGKLKVVVELYAPDWFLKKNPSQAKRRDASNYLKTSVDSVFKHLLIDDCWIFEETAVKKDANEFYTIIRISDLTA